MSAGHKILVVEDNEDLRDAVAESVEDVGHGVWFAANGVIGERSTGSKYALPR